MPLNSPNFVLRLCLPSPCPWDKMRTLPHLESRSFHTNSSHSGPREHSMSSVAFSDQSFSVWPESPGQWFLCTVSPLHGMNTLRHYISPIPFTRFPLPTFGHNRFSIWFLLQKKSIIILLGIPFLSIFGHIFFYRLDCDLILTFLLFDLSYLQHVI